MNSWRLRGKETEILGAKYEPRKTIDAFEAWSGEIYWNILVGWNWNNDIILQ